MKKSIIKDIADLLDLLEVKESIDLGLLQNKFYGNKENKDNYKAFSLSLSRAKNILSDKFFYKDVIQTLEFSDPLENITSNKKHELDPLKDLRLSKYHIGDKIKLVNTFVLIRIK